MTISLLSAGGSVWLIVAVVLCALILIRNVRCEIKGASAQSIPRTAAPAQPVPAQTADVPESGLSTEQVLAAAAYYWLHPEQPADVGSQTDK